MKPRSASERWVRLLLRLYPVDFREEIGESFVEAYLDRCRTAGKRGGTVAVAAVWIRAFFDSLINGVGERLRPAANWRRAGNWGRDAELAMRRLVRAPAFSLSMVGTLTVGLGAFAVVLTVVTKVLIEPLPYQRPNDLYFVWRDYGKVFDLKRGWVSGPDVAELGKAGGPIADAAGIRVDRRVIANAEGEGNPEEVDVMISSPNVFDLLGAKPLLGRTFAPNEVGQGRPTVIVLGYDVWQRRFAGARDVIGKTMKMNGYPYTIIGVMPNDFHFVRHSSLGPPQGASVYMTFNFDLAGRSPNSGSYAALLRAKENASPLAVRSAVAAVGKSMDTRFFGGKGISLYAVGLESDLVASVKPALMVLGISGLFLVLVLAVNLATLLLARAVQRDREFAVSRALGANPIALVRATLLEGGMLGAIGGAGAALAAMWGTRVLIALAPADMPRRESIVVDWKLALAVVGIGAMLGVLAAVAPAWWASRASLASLLRNAAVRGGGQGRLRRALVVVQVALCLVLLSSGGLVARSFDRLLRSNPGFDPSGVLTWRVPVAQWRYPTNAAAVAFHENLQRELMTIPGVRAASAASAVPLSGSTDQSDVTSPGAPGNTGKAEHDAPLADIIWTRPGWFSTMGIRLIAGRDFEPPRTGAHREAVVDRTFAEYFFPNSSPLGATLYSGNDTLTVVGVAEHARHYDLHSNGRLQVYMRDQDNTQGALYFAIRTSRPPVELIGDVRNVMHRLDPQLAISDVRTMEEVVSSSVREQRLSAVLIGGFSLGALLLAAMGLFGVVAGSVVRRKHEIAVRLALGAERGEILRLVVGEGAALVAMGILVAVPGIYLAGRLLRGVLIGVSPFDPLTLAAVATGLGAVALAACYVPARRVGGIQPAQALREE